MSPRRVLAALIAAAVAVGLYFTLLHPEPLPVPEPPKVEEKPVAVEPPFVPKPPSPPSPFRNTAAGVKYVGSAACVVCHTDLCDSYKLHPMGRSVAAVGPSPAIPGDGKPFENRGVRYLTEVRDGKLVHSELAIENGSTLARTDAVIDAVVGSGAHAHSYLLQRDGAVTQSPLTWFREKNAFDLSPGFRDLRDRFERPVVAGCLFCHTDGVAADRDAMNSFTTPLAKVQPIGCERCHGPGELHARDRANGPKPAGPDLSIVNPKHLSPPLREDVCNQCHLGGRERVVRRGKDTFDFRPGLPLEDFLRVLVLPEGVAQGHRVAGHVEQMHASGCFKQSAGAMGCVSCHDPHAVPKPEQTVAFFRAACVKCHEKKGCSEPLARRLERTKADDCTVCHMPKSATSTAHVALTDHRILRKRERDTAAVEPDILSALNLLAPFGQDRADDRDPELARDLAVAWTARARTQSDAVREAVSRRWLAALSRAAGDHPDDLPAAESLGVALAWRGMLPEALAVCESTLRRAPRRELVLSDAAVIAQKLGRNDLSLDYWKRALAVNPSSSRYRYEVANALFLQGNREAAAEECRHVLASNGGHVPSRLLLAQLYWEGGAKPQAKAELLVVLALHPPNEAALRVQFAEILR